MFAYLVVRIHCLLIESETKIILLIGIIFILCHVYIYFILGNTFLRGRGRGRLSLEQLSD